jgi:hypothetical protein
LKVLYPNSLRKDCNATQLIPELSDTSFVLELLRSQIGCAKDPAMSLTRFREGHSTAASMATSGSDHLNGIQETVIRRLHQHLEEWHLLIGIQWVMVTGLFVSFFIRKRRPRRYHYE